MNDALQKYISAARAKKLTNEQIKSFLLDAGWHEEQFQPTLLRSTMADLPVPPPPPLAKPITHIGMWVGFLYIIFFISLYVLATAVSWVLHLGVDKLMPNPTTTYTYYNSHVGEIRGLLAAILVAYPIFLGLELTLKKQLQKQPAVRNLRSRKILIYLTLIVTFLIMLIHIIMTINDFLSGTITTSALGHIAVTFLVAGAVFWYFIDEVKNDRRK